jgi:hypothetical protein
MKEINKGNIYGVFTCHNNFTTYCRKTFKKRLTKKHLTTTSSMGASL